MGFFDKMALKKYMKEADAVLAYEKEMAALSDEELKKAEKLFNIKERTEQFDGYDIAHLVKLSDKEYETFINEIIFNL